MLFIPISQLKGGMKLADDVLVFERSNVRLLKKGSPLSQKYIDGLIRFGVSGVYVKDEVTGDIMPSAPVIDTKTKTKTLQNLEWIYNSSTETEKKNNKSYIKNIDNTVVELMKLIRESKENSINISDLKAYDEYTYHHSLSVAVISIGLGMQLGLSEDELHKLGFGAIMHDIGKMNIPREIINKPGKLTEYEFGEMKKHSLYSEAYLQDNAIDDPEIYNSVMAHHEKVDGTGYPFGLKDKDIHLYAKIMSVADVYDALTSSRPYRDPEVPTMVAEYIMGNCGIAFDMDVVRSFISKIEFFPVGSFVELSNGKKAIVVENRKSRLRPVVKEVEPPFKTMDLFDDKSVYDIVITKLYEETPYSTLMKLGIG